MISEGDKLWILDGKGLERIEDNKVSWTVEAWVAEPGVLVRFGDGVAFAGWLKGVKADDPRLTDYGRSPRMIICVDGRGEVVWRTSVGARVRSLAVVRDEILVGCVDGVAYLVGEGEVRRYLPLGQTPFFNMAYYGIDWWKARGRFYDLPNRRFTISRTTCSTWIPTCGTASSCRTASG